MVNLGQRMYELRMARGFTKKEVAERIGISSKTYNSWERGLSRPRSGGILKLAKLYRVSCDLICGREELSPVVEEMLLATAFIFKIWSCPNKCGVPLELQSFIEGKAYGVAVQCPACKKGKFHSNDPDILEEFIDIKKKEAAMCANT